MIRTVVRVTAAALLCTGLAAAVGTTGASAALPAPEKYANCAALHKVYQHGVGRRGATDRVSGSTAPVTNFTVYTAAYNLNKAKLDRDKDGIACEKH